MNDSNPVSPPVAGATPGGTASPGVEKPPVQVAPATPPPGMARPEPGAPVVPIGTTGYKFLFPVDTPRGQEERREHERIRKAALRKNRAALVEPPPLRAVPSLDAPETPRLDEGFDSGLPSGEIVPAWTVADVAEFTDELVELSEAKRVTDFVVMAREANLPPRLVSEIERDAGYGTKTKAALKKSIAATIAKWLNKTGVSAKNKEEAALLFAVITIKMQGVRLRRDIVSLTEAEQKRREAEAEKAAPKSKPDARLV